MIMNNAPIQNRIVRIFAFAVAFAAIATCVPPHGGTHTARVREARVSAHHAIQVADGSESNGGKGGKGGAKRSAIA